MKINCADNTEHRNSIPPDKGWLALHSRPHETIRIGENIWVFSERKNGIDKIYISCPKDILISRVKR